VARSRFRIFLASASATLILSAALVTAQGQQLPAPDPERGFALGDSDLDGKLSLDEFRDLLLNGARLKNAAAKKPQANPERLFGRLDADRDGSLTLAEYRQLAALFRQGQGGGMGGLGPFAKARAKAKGERVEAVSKPISSDQLKFFEARIRPVLATKCASCHSDQAAKAQGGLRVDTREGLLRGGDTGAAIVPGRPDESRLIAAIRHEEESLRMPPKGGKLTDEVIADFEAWVAMGAPDPRDASASTSKAKARSTPVVDKEVEEARRGWAFQIPKATTPPKVKDAAWPKTDVDRFLLAGLEAQGLRPVDDADRRTLIRRASFDLVGLPPSPEEVEAFVFDTSPDAFAKVVDRLLASPRFGERWGRHWLDVARFAESSGKANLLYSNAWRYRDWVIAALNADKPYDAFVKEQVAGDLLPASDPRERADHLVATGFLALGSKTHNTRNRQQFLVDLADEQVDATSQAFLGLTVACARCHDHKFDPISQRDYSALSGIFQSTQTRYGTLPGLVQNANPSPLIELPEAARAPSAQPTLTPDRLAALQAQLAELLKARDALTPDENFSPKGFQTRTRVAVLKFRVASYRPDGTPRAYAMGAVDRPEPVDSPFYVRGELEHPDGTIPRGLIRVLCADTPPPIERGSGRLELANWLASRENPLTARVMVNRVWLHLFGRGLVATPDNFGAAGQPPSHPELLDTLAASFMDQGWSVKGLIRRIMLSRGYQLASTHDPKAFSVDPDNALVWRMSPRRLEAEPLRDAILAVSGKLDLTPPVGSPVGLAGEGPAGPFRGFQQDAQDRHRAVYLPVVRDLLPESLSLFDFADPSLPAGERATTSGPTQALYLMNSPFVIRQAEAAAARLLADKGDDVARVELAYRRFLSRPPTSPEIDRARAFLAGFSKGDLTPLAAWTAFCQALYASGEFRYLD
jgi:cytochrome c553